MIYYDVVRPEVMKEHPGKMPQWMGIMSDMYKKLDAAERKKYEDMHAEKVKLHAEAVKAFEESGRKAEFEKAVKALKQERKEEMTKDKANKKGKKTTKKKGTTKTTKKKGG